MKIKTVISADNEEEILIRCKSKTEQIKRIESILENLLICEKEMVLTIAETDYYILINDILFFESFDGKIYAHTKNRIFTCKHKLYELEAILPSIFVRISKSTIANIMTITSLRRELVGNGEITFKDCGKKAYFSRGYYKHLRDKMDEMRLGK